MSAARTIPLADIAITLPSRRHFPNDSTDPITLSGAKLALMLDWIERSGKLKNGDGKAGLLEEVRVDLLGLSELLFSLSTTDLSNNVIDAAALFRLLYKIARDLTARLGAIDDTAQVLKHATVTIGAAAPEAAR
jgi:hypothetical protein